MAPAPSPVDIGLEETAPTSVPHAESSARTPSISASTARYAIASARHSCNARTEGSLFTLPAGSMTRGAGR